MTKGNRPYSKLRGKIQNCFSIMLYIVATPIGNLEDISLRALRILKEVDFILAEDTRVTRKLLSHYEINTPLINYQQHSGPRKINNIIRLLRNGKNLALVTDAGTPSISDPGAKLVQEVIKQLPGVKIVPLPGPSAVVVAASIAGFPMDRFVFLGFPPTKRKRKKFFQEIDQFHYPVILYESPYRVLKTLKDIQEFVSNRKIVVARELTKKFETIYRGEVNDIIKKIPLKEIKGEFVIILDKK